MEVITPEQLKKRYNIQDVSNTPKAEPQKQASVVITPEQLKQKYGIQDANVEEKKPSILKTLGGAISRPVMQPLARTGQAIALGIAEASGNEELKNRAYQNVEKPVADPVFGTEIAGVKRFGEGAGKQIAGQALESATTLYPYSRVAGAVKSVATPVLGKAVGKVVAGSIAGGSGGYLADVGMNLQDGKNIGDSLTPGFGTALGTSIPIVGAGLSKVGKKVGVLSRPPDELKDIVSKNIDNVYSGVTGDADQISNLKSKAQKGLELYTKENKTINTKNPNELISSVNKLKGKISTIARSAAEKASKTGIKINTSNSEKVVLDALDNREISKSFGNDLLFQIRKSNGDPLKLHDWIQKQVNMKLFKNSGDLKTSQFANVANDAAEVLRKDLDFIVDREGYAEAFGNIKELQRMLVIAAKKANRTPFQNIGDVTTEAGLDAGISLLTGNPLYMVRTIGSGLLKGVFSKLRNTSGLRSLKKASSAMSKMDTKTKLPSGEIKPADILKQSKETQMFTPKNRVTPSVDNQNLSPNIQGKPNIQNASTKIDSKIIIPKVSPKPKETSIGKSPVETIDLPRDLYEQGIVLDLQRQEFANNPLKSLIKYMNKRTNELPEITAKGKGIFRNKGDDIISRDSFGFRDKNGNVDSEKVREAFSEFLPKYRQYKKDIADYAKEVKGYIKTATQQKEYDKAINGFLDSADEYNKMNQTIDEYLKQPVKEKKPSLLQTLKKNKGEGNSSDILGSTKYQSTQRKNADAIRDTSFTDGKGFFKGGNFSDVEKQSAKARSLEMIKKLRDDIKNNGQRGSAEMFKNVDDNLIQEAKKYKSAEDFVKAQGTPVYHGTKSNIGIDELSSQANSRGQYLGDGIYFTKYKEGADLYGGKTLEAVVNDSDFLDISKLKGVDRTKEIGSLGTYKQYLKNNDLVDSTKNFDTWSKNQKNVSEKVIKMGYKGITDGQQHVIFDKTALKTKSQLTDIWNKAQSTQGKAKIGTVGQVAGVTALGVAGANLYNKKK